MLLEKWNSVYRASPGGSSNQSASRGVDFNPWMVQEEPTVRKGMATAPVFLPGEFWDRGAWRATTAHGVAELDDTFKLTLHFRLAWHTVA